MDTVDRCKNKLEHFRIKELKDVLTRAGLSKQGKKQDLMDRVLALLYDEGTPGLYKNINGKEDLVAIIDDAYRKMQDAAIFDSNAKKQSSISSHRQQLQEEAGPVKVCCVCGHSAVFDVPIQCADLNCDVWQHIGCAIMPEQGIQKHPGETQFFCQTCRIKRADPDDAEHPDDPPEPLSHAPTLPDGPITRARARQFEEAIQAFVKGPYEELKTMKDHAITVLFTIDDQLHILLGEGKPRTTLMGP